MKGLRTKGKTMKIVSLLLTVSLFMTAQDFTVFADSISENVVIREEEQEGKQYVEETEQSVDLGNEEELGMEERSVSENAVQAGEEVPANPVHYHHPWGNPLGMNDYTDWSYIYFGSYPQSQVLDRKTISDINEAMYKAGVEGDAGIDVWVDGTKYRRIRNDEVNDEGRYFYGRYQYYKWERIKWRVLKNDGNTLFIVADKPLDCKDYNEDDVNVTWENSTIRNWLNNSFYITAFSKKEQAVIAEQTIVNEDNDVYATEGGNNTKDKIYLLSKSEATDYRWYGDGRSEGGFCRDNSESRSRHMKPSDYAHARGVWIYDKSTNSDIRGNCMWWLRSPGADRNRAMFIAANGYLDRSGELGFGGGSVAIDHIGICPALRIKLSSDMPDTWYMTDDGTSGDGGGDQSKVHEVLCTKAGIEYHEEQMVALSTETEGADIYYTIDGTKPSKENGILYTGEILIGEDLTLKAVAVKEGLIDSEIFERSFTFTPEKPKKVYVPELELTEPQSGSVDDKKVFRFFPGSWSQQGTAFPVTVSKFTNVDGSFQLRFAIGIARADWLNNDTEWSRYKKNVRAMVNELDEAVSLERLKNLPGGGPVVSCYSSPGKFVKKPQLSVVGYYQMDVDKNGNIVKNTGMAQGDLKWNGSADWKFATPIGPMYLSLGGGGKITGRLGISYELPDDSNSKGKWNKEGEVVINPGISVEGGWGLPKAASIGARGTADVFVKVLPESSAYFLGKASVHVYYLFFCDKTWDLATCKFNLWPRKKDKSTSRSGLSEAAITDMNLSLEEFELVDRSYAEHTTVWKGNTVSSKSNDKNLLARAGTEEGDKEETGHVLQSGVMPNTLPMIKQVGSDTVMVFQANAAERNTLNSSVLMYSVYSNGTWSEPVPVWDNGTSDMYADMQLVGEDLYLVWQKVNSQIEADGEDILQAISEIAEKSEICFAKYDQTEKKFKDVAYITSDKKVDMMPKLAVSEDKVAVAWITNSENSFLSNEGIDRIVYVDLENDVFSEEKVLCERQSGVEEFVPYYENGVLYAAYVSNTPEENGTNQVFLSSFNEGNKEVSEGSTLAHNLQWSDGVLYYCEDGSMKAYDMKTGILSGITAGESPIGANGRIYTNDGKTAVIWSASDQKAGTFNVYSSVKTAEGFSEPVALYSTASSISYLDGVLKSDGSWQFVLNTADIEGTEDITAEPLHSLVFVTKEEAPEVKVASITVDDAAKENETTPISYIVTNTSEETITNLVLTITDESGLNKQQIIPVSIMPGETIYETVDVDLTEVKDTTKANITITAQGQTDTGSNTVEAVIGQTDLTLKAIMTETEEDVCIVASVSNNSIIPANATLTLYGDVEQTSKLEEVSLGKITKDRKGSHTFYLKKSDLTMNENGAAYMPLVVTSDKTDSNEDDNTVIKIAYAVLDNSVKNDNLENDKKDDTTENNNKGEGESSKAEVVKVTKLTISAPSKKLAAGKKVKLTLEVTPKNVSNKAVIWKTSNKKYATVDKNGKITLKKAGAGKSVTITASAKDGSGKKATIKIKIMKHAVKSIKLKAPAKTLKAGKSMSIKATVKTTGKSVNKTLKWQSSNTKYATVNKKGKVTAKKAGKGKTVTITAASTDGSNKKVKVKIKIK